MELVSNCEAGMRERLLAPDCRLSRSDVLWRLCQLKGLCDFHKVIRSLATYFFEAMEGHFDCKLIAVMGNSCEVVICPSREICRNYKVNLLLDLKQLKLSLLLIFESMFLGFTMSMSISKLIRHR